MVEPHQPPQDERRSELARRWTAVTSALRRVALTFTFVLGISAAAVIA